MKNIKIKSNSKDDNEIRLIMEKNFDNFNKNSFKTVEVIFLIIITSLVSLFVGYILNNKSKNNNDKYIQEIIDNYNLITNEYYGDVDKDKLVSGAVDGMISSLGDDYSTLLTEDTSSSFYMNLEGSYEGIGVEVYNNDNNDIVVLGVLDGSPAEKAGVKAGDIIKQIDDTSLENTKMSELTKYIKANNKKEYSLIIVRDGSEQKFVIERSTVTIKSISSKIIEKSNHKIGYIYISIFSNSTTSQFVTALNDLEKQGIDSLIIDVRENSGGHLTTASAILSSLMDSKHIIYQIEKDGKKTKYYSNGEKTKKYPIVIIQNGNSASASELLSSALKESYGATIVGENSYGKGTVQEVVNLSNGDTYKFTTKKWLTPNGNWVNKKGIKPDINVSLDDNYKDNPSDDTDNQLQTAINAIIENK